MQRKTLKELTLKDNFMFGAVMSIEENCRRFLEMVLQFPIERVVVSKEKSMIYHPEYKGVRFDIFGFYLRFRSVWRGKILLYIRTAVP